LHIESLAECSDIFQTASKLLQGFWRGGCKFSLFPLTLTLASNTAYCATVHTRDAAFAGHAAPRTPSDDVIVLDSDDKRKHWSRALSRCFSVTRRLSDYLHTSVSVRHRPAEHHCRLLCVAIHQLANFIDTFGNFVLTPINHRLDHDVCS